MNLAETAVFTAKNKEELLETLRCIDKATSYNAVSADDIEFGVISPEENMDGVFRVRIAPGKESYSLSQMTKTFNVEPVDIRLIQNNILTETFSTGVMIRFPGEDWMPISERAIQDLQRFVGIYGEGVMTHCPEEMDLLSRLIRNRIGGVEPDGAGVTANDMGKCLRNKNGKKKEFRFKIMSRTDPDTGKKKVFAVRTSLYKAIEQTEIINMVDAIEMNGKTPTIEKAIIDHYMTWVYVSFPEIGEEFSKTFNLEKKVIPGYCISTSDTGDSSFAVKSVLFVDNGDGAEEKAVFDIPALENDRRRASKKHTGIYNSQQFQNIVSEDLYATFKKYPERIANLITIGDLPVRSALKLAFESMQLQRKSRGVHQDKLEKLINELCEMMEDEYADAYNIVFAAMTACDNPNVSLNETERCVIREKALLALDANYETLEEVNDPWSSGKTTA